MKRYISNYTILYTGEEFVNHITTIDDDGFVVSITAFDREMGNTRYVPIPICITTTEHLDCIKKAFLKASTRQEFKSRLLQEIQNNIEQKKQEKVIVLSLDFKTRTINRI